jgi:hypothetical protein
MITGVSHEYITPPFDRRRKIHDQQFSFFNTDTTQSENFASNFPIYKMWEGYRPPTLKTIFSDKVDSKSNDSPESTPSPTPSPTDSLRTKPQSVKYTRMNLTPSGFTNGCVCGHHVEFRDFFCDVRKRRNTRCPGVTIRPKTLPIMVKLRTCN